MPSNDHPLPSMLFRRDCEAHTIRAGVRAGRLERVAWGAYLESSGPHDDPERLTREPWHEERRHALARIRAAARRLHARAVISHQSAALLHGLWLWRLPEEPHVTQRQKPPGGHARDIVRHSNRLAETDVTTVAGIRVTTIERTVADCLASLPGLDALIIADSGLRLLSRARRDDPVGSLERALRHRDRILARIESGQPRGRRRARAVIDVADPLSESAQESRLRWILLMRGFPPPVCQFRVLTRDGPRFTDLAVRLDGTPLAEATRPVLLEYDGRGKYLKGHGAGAGSSAGEASALLLAEKRREDAIREASGARVLRFDAEDLRSADAVVARVLAALPPGAGLHLRPRPELR